MATEADAYDIVNKNVQDFPHSKHPHNRSIYK